MADIMHVIDTTDNQTTGGKTGWSWEQIPAPIPESEIAETADYEVVVVGGGISGLATLARCSQLGLKTVVIEKTKGLVAHGAHIACLDSPIMRKLGVKIDKKEFARAWMRISGSRINEDLLWLYINRSEEAFLWLLEMGGKDIGADLYGGAYRGPDFTEYSGTHYIFRTENSRYKYGGALLMCEIMEDSGKQHGGEVYRETRALQLEKKDGRVTAVIAENKDGKKIRYRASRGVVLATGDISGNPEMLQAFAPLGLKPVRNGGFPKGTNLGEGHKMGYWAGGAFENSPWAISLHLIGWSLYIFFFLHVNRQGKRFMNEDTWAQAKSIRCLMQPQGEFAWTVFDSKWYEEVSELAKYGGGQFTDPLICPYGEAWDNPYNNVREVIEKYMGNGYGFRCDTIEELARKMDVPVENFTATVARYNELKAKGDDEDYGKRSVLLTSIDKPPYYALKFGPALLTVFGGLLIDTGMRVLDKTHTPVPGLFAVGNVSAGLHAIDYPLLLNGNSHGRALTWARRAAETLSEQK